MIATVLFREVQILERVDSLAQEIAKDYVPRSGLHTITVLNGALHFASALRFAIAKANPDLGFVMTSDTIHLASYHGTDSSGEVKKISDLTHSVEGKHVLIRCDTSGYGFLYVSYIFVVKSILTKLFGREQSIQNMC
ncbi:hypothetical protein IPL68_00030 [Candidatus Saccharibacteria bacterium]|nr:MAG: hypothetical protein IPL68_00030 [Candidatus Saccharibacteria bacterium]